MPGVGPQKCCVVMPSGWLPVERSMDLRRELEIMERLARLEKQMDFLLGELGLSEKEKATPPRLDLSGVKDLLRRGNKLEAVRHYRDRTGVSLAEATKAIEGIEQEISRE